MALCVLAACSSNDTASLSTATRAPLSGEPPVSPASTPDRDPCATETNFLALVCFSDADCAPAGGYCEPYPEADAGAQPPSAELAASTGPTGACPAPSASALAPASGPADTAAASAAAEEQPPADEPASPSADAGAQRPIGRCVIPD